MIGVNEFLNIVNYRARLFRRSEARARDQFQGLQAMSQVKLNDTSANCPQCRTEMVHVAVTPHPVVRTMQRNTFVCYSCKRTRTYMLPSLAAVDVQAGEAGAPPAVSLGAS